jgi:N-acetylglucosamine-6-phosphate deacetylase
MVEFDENFGPADADLFFETGFISPGLVELQLNGGLGYDFTQTPHTIYQVAEALPRWGVTAFLPTLITAPLEAYKEGLQIVAEAQHNAKGARVLGAHLEGPYLNPKYKGAHELAYLRLPSLTEVETLIQAGPFKVMTIAPELPGALEVIKYLKANGVQVAAGHSSATYIQAKAAFEAGVTYVTHLFNAMLPLHHREPGLVGAALADDSVLTGIIADGIHLHPAIVRMVYRTKIFGLSLVTDSMAGMGMSPGQYNLAGQAVVVDESSARLDNAKGTLAGSILTLDQAIRNLMKFTDCDIYDATEMTCVNAARFLGLTDAHTNLEMLSPGHPADLVVWDEATQVKLTLIGGNIAYTKAT